MPPHPPGGRWGGASTHLVVEAALAVLAERELRAEGQRYPLRSRTGWLKAKRRELGSAHGERLRALHEASPELAPEALADALVAERDDGPARRWDSAAACAATLAAVVAAGGLTSEEAAGVYRAAYAEHPGEPTAALAGAAGVAPADDPLRPRR